MTKFLREDNTVDNCTVESDLFPMTGRAHSWHWISQESNWRICHTCGREELNVREKHVPPPREVWRDENPLEVKECNEGTPGDEKTL